MRYDVVIVGAGPAGSTLAALLSQGGFSVLLIDKAKFPRRKLCGGILTTKTTQLIRRVLPNLRYDSHIITAVEVFHKQSKQLHIRLIDALNIIDRYNFDYELVKYAQQCGAVFMPSTNFIGIELASGIIRISGGHSIHFGVLVGADGVHSAVRKNMNLQRNKMGFCVGTHIITGANSDAGHEFQKRTAQLYYGEFDQGYLWKFPILNKCVVGAGSIVDNVDEKMVLCTFNEFLLNKHIMGQEKTHCAYLPSGENTEFGAANSNTYLVGDAAGLIDPITGEGLYFAIYSSYVLANILLSNSPRFAYEAYCQKMRPVLERIKIDCYLRDKVFEPLMLSQTLQALGQAPEYASQLIHDTVCSYQKSYHYAFTEINELLR